eukprot:1608793-Amphidinium_carterae.1
MSAIAAQKSTYGHHQALVYFGCFAKSFRHPLFLYYAFVETQKNSKPIIHIKTSIFLISFAIIVDVLPSIQNLTLNESLCNKLATLLLK